MHIISRLSPCLGALLAAARGLLLLLPLPAEAAGEGFDLDFKLGQGFGLDFKVDLGAVQQALGGELPPSLCETYATVANYSAVWADPRMRAALQDAHDPDERAAVGRLLDACGRAVGQFTESAALNDHCGNLTAVARDEAARNFSRGIVADRVVGGGPISGPAANSPAAAGLAPWGHLVGVAVLVSLVVALP